MSGPDGNTDPASKQRRGRRIALTPEELDDFLGQARTCRVATVRSGRPHVSPLWFLWHDGSLWLYSIVDSQRFRDLQENPAVAVVVDDGDSYQVLRGVEVAGIAEVVGDVPRMDDAAAPELTEVEGGYARKYQGRDELRIDGKHAWLRVRPDSIVSWDFRKLGIQS